MKYPHDLTGLPFSHWTVVKRAANMGKQSAWLCKCVCGKQKTVARTSLVKETSRSCGCQRWKLTSDSARNKRGKEKAQRYIGFEQAWAEVSRSTYASLAKMAQEAMA